MNECISYKSIGVRSLFSIVQNLNGQCHLLYKQIVKRQTHMLRELIHPKLI